MRRLAATGFSLLVAAVLTGCGGRAASPFVGVPPASTALALNPSPLDLTSDAPVATLTAQNDVAGVNYTAHADPSCTGPSGSIVVAGDGVAQLDVAGSPLLFLAAAVGTPPASCSMTVTGSDGTSATAQLTYSDITYEPGQSLVAAHPQHVSMAGGAVSPSTVTFTKPTDYATISASGFTGVTKSATSCSGTGSVSVAPASFTSAATITVLPYQQGALSGSCTVTFTDSASNTAALKITFAAPALKKMTVTPSTAQFSCDGAKPQQTCTTGTVTIAETNAQTFRINNSVKFAASCANVFNGPLKMTNGNGTYATYTAGPQATVSFLGLLTAPSITCSKIVLGDGTGQTVAVSVNPQTGAGTASVAAANCTGPDPYVPTPNAPHGLYVWNPWRVTGNFEKDIETYVIGKDHALCGASVTINWSEVEATKGVFTWNAVDGYVAPYVAAGLRVNLLFIDAPEGDHATNTITPTWVTGADGVQLIHCPGNTPIPDYLDPTYLADYEAFIQAAIAHFSDPNVTGITGAAPYYKNIGYLRFGIGNGSEAYPGKIESPNTSPKPCLQAWAAATPNFTYQAWLNHTVSLIRYMAQQKTDKQLMVSLNYVSTYAANPDHPELDTTVTNDVYTYTNAAALAAASNGIGFGVQNLGISGAHGVFPAAATTVPAPCDPSIQVVDISWCQAFNRHVGKVPLEFQPIVSPIVPGNYQVTLPHLLQYGLDNNAQIFELYPEDWLFANNPALFTNTTLYPGAAISSQVEDQAALQAASQILGRATPTPGP